MTTLKSKISSAFGFMAACLLSVFSRSASKLTTDDLKKAEFKTSTQKMGIRITETVRSVFRHRWLKKR